MKVATSHSPHEGRSRLVSCCYSSCASWFSYMARIVPQTSLACQLVTCRILDSHIGSGQSATQSLNLRRPRSTAQHASQMRNGGSNIGAKAVICHPGACR